MDASYFDRWARLFAAAASRRQAALALFAGALMFGQASEDASAESACKSIGVKCRHARECCSGVCNGKQRKQRCRAHDTGGCRGGSSSTLCAGSPVSCTTSAGLPGRCGTTTGNAGYCVGGGDCFPCTRDADCRAVCGPHAACVQCAVECSVGTVCAGPDGVVCSL